MGRYTRTIRGPLRYRLVQCDAILDTQVSHHRERSSQRYMAHSAKSSARALSGEKAIQVSDE